MFELYPHQEEAVRKLHNGSILCGGVGTGKTHAAIGYYLKQEAPKPLFVITTAKTRNALTWEAVALEAGITPDPETTMASVITVDSWNNIDKYKEITGGFFIFDEQRLVGSGVWTKAFLKIAKSNNWIMLSATPGDNWLDYIPVFLANGFYKNRTAFQQEHVVYVPRLTFPKVSHYRGVGRLVRLRNQILVDMPYERHTTRVEIDIPVDYDKELFRKVVKERWHVYENRPLRDVSELFVVMRKVVNSDASRLQALRKLMRQHPKVIVFYNFDYELEILRTLSTSSQRRESDSSTQTKSESSLIFTNSSSDPSSHTQATSTVKPTQSSTPQHSQSHYAVAEYNGHKHQPIPRTDNWVYLVQYQAGAESWNCIETDAMVFYSPTYSYKQDHQAHGRIDRLNTSYLKLWYYRLLSSSPIDEAVMESLRAKKSFNERAFVTKSKGLTDLTDLTG